MSRFGCAARRERLLADRAAMIRDVQASGAVEELSGRPVEDLLVPLHVCIGCRSTVPRRSIFALGRRRRRRCRACGDDFLSNEYRCVAPLRGR